MRSKLKAFSSKRCLVSTLKGPHRGWGVLLKIQGGGFFRRGRGGVRQAGRVSVGNLGVGGAKSFWRSQSETCEARFP